MDVLYRDASDGNLHMSTVKDICVDSSEGFDVWLDDKACCKNISRADYEEVLTEGFRNECVDFSNFYFDEIVDDDTDER